MITTENAATLQKLGVEARRKKQAEIESKLSVIDELNWPQQELLRVREHIARLNRDLETATETVDILRLTQSLSKLYEVAGLPKAGAYRPELGKDKSKVATAPLD